METIIKKTIFRVFIALSFFYAIPLETFGITDDDIDAVFMTVALNNGQNESVMLSNDISFSGPLFQPAAKTLTINNTCYNTEDVKAIRFEIRQVDAIQEMESNKEQVADGFIYNLNGQLVGKIDVGENDDAPIVPTLEGLPKGVYIVNGKKVIVR